MTREADYAAARCTVSANEHHRGEMVEADARSLAAQRDLDTAERTGDAGLIERCRARRDDAVAWAFSLSDAGAERDEYAFNRATTDGNWQVAWDLSHTARKGLREEFKRSLELLARRDEALGRYEGSFLAWLRTKL